MNQLLFTTKQKCFCVNSQLKKGKITTISAFKQHNIRITHLVCASATQFIVNFCKSNWLQKGIQSETGSAKSTADVHTTKQTRDKTILVKCFAEFQTISNEMVYISVGFGGSVSVDFREFLFSFQNWCALRVLRTKQMVCLVKSRRSFASIHKVKAIHHLLGILMYLKALSLSRCFALQKDLFTMGKYPLKFYSYLHSSSLKKAWVALTKTFFYLKSSKIKKF